MSTSSRTTPLTFTFDPRNRTARPTTFFGDAMEMEAPQFGAPTQIATANVPSVWDNSFKAPAGYNRIKEDMVIRVYVVEVNGYKKVQDVVVLQGLDVGVNIADKNIAGIKIRNTVLDILEADFKMENVDERGNKIRQDGVKYEIVVRDVLSGDTLDEGIYETNDSGDINLSDMNLPRGNSIISITQKTAPVGYKNIKEKFN